MVDRLEAEITLQDVEYQRQNGRPLLATVYRPAGSGPFPTLVEAHGGAWVHHDRASDNGLNRAMAERGILTVAIDFRLPPEAGYPASVTDLNLAIRWLKVHAVEFGGTSKVGAAGVSSGAHLAILSGLRPRDARYAELPLPGHPEVDASLAYVVACWPPSDPLYRYRHARRLGKDGMVKDHDDYWGTEDAMAEGSPPLILERGEPVELPPILVIQRTVDENHPLEMQERLVHWYRQRGGQIEMPLYENLPWWPGWRYAVQAEYPDTGHVMDAIVDFVRRFG